MTEGYFSAWDMVMMDMLKYTDHDVLILISLLSIQYNTKGQSFFQSFFFLFIFSEERKIFNHIIHDMINKIII